MRVVSWYEVRGMRYESLRVREHSRRRIDSCPVPHSYLIPRTSYLIADRRSEIDAETTDRGAANLDQRQLGAPRADELGIDQIDADVRRELAREGQSEEARTVAHAGDG